MIQSSNNNPTDNAQQSRSDSRQLSTLIDMESPEAVHAEVKTVLRLISSSIDPKPIDRVFRFTVDLYQGRLPQYQACNTDYHNLRHITDTYLAMARLLHGALLSGEEFSDRDLFLGLTGALMHDAGMVQEADDTEGTGAKYTEEHVRLSMDFVEKHAATLGTSGQEVVDLQDMILCTDLAADIDAIRFSSAATELLGKILGTADLIAQMADRTYLEKLLFLYHEFREAEIGSFKNETDFMQQTLDFFAMSLKRFKETLDDTSRFMLPHFKRRWDIDENLYMISLTNQRDYLKKILAARDIPIYKKLKRGNIVAQVFKKFGHFH